jgi:hypothetical protein
VNVQLTLHQRAEFFGRRRRQGKILLRHPLPNGRISHRFLEGAIQHGHDLFRHIWRAEKPCPWLDLEVGETGFGHGRHIRRDGAALFKDRC